MSNAFTTWFSGEWSKFLNWFGSAEAAVVAEGKTIIDELVPVFEKDLLADGSTVLVAATTALASATNPVTAIASAATALIPALEAQGISLSSEAATTLAAFVSAKIQAANAAISTAAATTPAA